MHIGAIGLADGRGRKQQRQHGAGLVFGAARLTLNRADQIPQPQRAIFAARTQPTIARRKSQRRHCALMARHIALRTCAAGRDHRDDAAVACRSYKLATAAFSADRQAAQRLLGDLPLCDQLGIGGAGQAIAAHVTIDARRVDRLCIRDRDRRHCAAVRGEQPLQHARLTVVATQLAVRASAQDLASQQRHP